MLAAQGLVSAYDPQKQLIKESYDEIALDYKRWSLLSHDYRVDYLQHLYEDFPQLKSEPMKVLELGCGSGQPVLETLLANNPKLHATGNELSDSQLNLARKYLAPYADRLTLVQGDMAALDFEPGSLSAVIGLYTILHLPSHEQIELIGKISQWLKPSGRFLINFEQNATENEVWGEWLDGKGRLVQYGPGREAMMQSLRQHGFEIDLETLQPSDETGNKSYVWVIGRK